jgi:iron(III) transport system ATP-binding protein
MSVVTISNVTKAFGDVVVLKNFNDEFKDGEFITLLGPSGCGKTTMLRMIAGFEKPTSGEIRIDDKIVSSDTVFVPPEKREIGMVFQSYAVWPHMNVFDNVAYPLKIMKVPKNEIKQRVMEILETVHLSQYAERIPSQLSGGQQQRVALGRALVAAPKLLLLDEPLSNLDAKLRESMRYEIKEIQKKMGITVVFVTHDQVEAMTMSDRVFVINRGVVQQVGTPYEIYRNPANQFVADFVGKVNFIKGYSQNGKVTLHGICKEIPYKGELEGDVIVTIRPESIKIVPKEEAEVTGKLTKYYFLGNENDCFIDINGVSVRVVVPSGEYDQLQPGQEVHLQLRDYIVHKDTGNDDHTKILT